MAFGVPDWIIAAIQQRLGLPQFVSWRAKAAVLLDQVKVKEQRDAETEELFPAQLHGYLATLHSLACALGILRNDRDYQSNRTGDTATETQRQNMNTVKQASWGEQTIHNQQRANPQNQNNWIISTVAPCSCCSPLPCTCTTIRVLRPTQPLLDFYSLAIRLASRLGNPLFNSSRHVVFVRL